MRVFDLDRERAVSNGGERYVGAVGIGAERVGGGVDSITSVELGRNHLRLELTGSVAEVFGDAVLVEFDFDDEEFAQLRRELLAMFTGLLDVHEV